MAAIQQKGDIVMLFFDIAPNEFFNGFWFYRINERVPANSKQNKQTTLLANNGNMQKISYKATDFLSSSDKFPDTKAIHYFLRNDKWTSQPKNKEEII